MTDVVPLGPLFSPDAEPGPAGCRDLTGEPAVDAVEAAAIGAARDGGARALWRTWHTGGGRVFLLWGPAAAATGQPVEVFADPATLDARRRAALARSALLWTAEPTPEIRFAGLYDAYDEATGPVFDDAHPLLEGVVQQRILDYLGAAPRLVSTTVTAGDVFDETAQVSMDLRTDGVWVWSEGTREYLGRYGLAPEPAFGDHLAALGYRLPPVTAVGLHRAMAAVQKPL